VDDTGQKVRPRKKEVDASPRVQKKNTEKGGQCNGKGTQHRETRKNLGLPTETIGKSMGNGGLQVKTSGRRPNDVGGHTALRKIIELHKKHQYQQAC